MNKRDLRIVGIFSIFLGIVFLLDSFSGITGFVVFEGIKKSASSILGTIFIVGGLILVIVVEGGLERKTRKIVQEIDQTLRSGKIGKYEELERYAKKLGYRLEEGSNHKNVYKGDYRITEIPRHRREVATGTYRSILRALRDNAA